jgi:serine protein kinase
MGENTTTAPVAAKPQGVNRVAALAKKFDRDTARDLAKQLTVNEYLNVVYDEPRVSRTAYQRIYDMIVEAGTEKYTKYRKTITRYKFFDDPEVPIFGLEDTLYDLVQVFRGAAGGYGTERRLILLRGPVGSSKSTICALLKKGLERYTQSKAGAIYTYSWVNLDKVPGKEPGWLYNQPTAPCPMHDDPLKLLPDDVRKQVVEELNSILNERYQKAVKDAKAANKDVKSIPVPHRVMVPGHLNPRCQYFWDQLMAAYDYDWQKVVENHVVVHRFSFSEDKRIGIGTFQPKDEKNQDATELTGDINYMALSHYGVDSDPRAFSFDGEFEIANRGFCEFIEILKLAKEFLYDILGATQERKVKPKKFPQVDIDEVLIGHTNNPEHEKMMNDRTMEALRDRTIVLNVPYLLEWSKELRILERDYGPQKIKQHIAPHTLEIAALWAICTRLYPDPDNKVSKVEKAKLYDGRALPGYTEDTVKEMRDRHPKEGLDKGMSARYVQNAISQALVENERYINPFMVLNILERNLKNCGTITSEQDREDYAKDIVLAKSEYDDIVKNEVQRALVADENAIVQVFANYMDNVYAHMNGTKVKHPYTGEDMDPDERLMRSIEEKIDIHEQAADDFRRSIAGFAGKLAHDGKKFEWDSNPRLKRALELKMFEDTKDTIKLSKLGLGAQVVDPDLQEKIDAIKTRLIRNYGYNEESAKDVLDYVGSIFARGDVQE